jgi:hypothetical protein
MSLSSIEQIPRRNIKTKISQNVASGIHDKKARIQYFKGKRDVLKYAEMSTRLCCFGNCEGMPWLLFVNDCCG